MNETTTKPQKQNRQRSWFGVASLGFGILGWFLFAVYQGAGTVKMPIPQSFRWSMWLFWLIALTLGWIALVRIKQERLARKHRYSALVGVWISAIPLVLFVISFFWPGFPLPRQRPFSECDPKKVIAIIEKRGFDFTFPDTIKDAKAVETRTTWLEHTYMFLLRFSTNQEGWEEFHRSFPKIKDHATRYIDVDGREEIHDVYDFMDYDTNEYEPRIEPFWGWPKWFKAKIRKGKYFSGYLDSKDYGLQIDTLIVDVADSEDIRIYIEGWGPYDPNYGVD